MKGLLGGLSACTGEGITFDGGGAWLSACTGLTEVSLLDGTFIQGGELD